MLILRKLWESQPQVVPGIDWSNALCRGLVFCAVPFGTTMVDVVTGVAGTRTGAMTVRPSSTNGGRSRNGDGIGIAASGTNTDQIVWPVSLARGGSITSTGTVLALGGTTEQVDGKIYIFGGNTETVTAGDGFSVGIDSFSYLGRGNVTRHRFASALWASGGSEVVGNPFNDRVHFFGYGFTANGANGTWFANRGGSTWSGGAVFGTTTTNRRALVHTSGDGRTENSKNAFVNLFLIWDREISVAEYQSLYDNPWQLFEPYKIIIPASTLGGSFTLDAIAGSLALTGSNASLLKDSLLSSNAGSYTLTGNTASLVKGIVLSANSGSYSLTGSAAQEIVTRLLAAGSGSYSLTGAPADLASSGGGAYTLDANSGSYLLLGSDVSFSYSGATVTLKAGSWIRYRIIT